jgi:hypothetical protein
MRKLVVVGFALVLLSFNPLVGAYKESDQLNGGETTHQFMMDRIPIILENDGYPFLADYLVLNLDQMGALHGPVHTQRLSHVQIRWNAGI